MIWPAALFKQCAHGAHAFGWNTGWGVIRHYQRGGQGRPEVVFRGPDRSVTTVQQIAAHPKLPRVAMVGKTTAGTLVADLIDAQTEELVRTVDLPAGTESVRFSPDGKTLFAIKHGEIDLIPADW